MVQSALPLHLLDRFTRARDRWSVALDGASRGDYSKSHDLEAVSRYLGRLVAAEAKTTAQRGRAGAASLLELSLLVDRAFPELRGWNQQVALMRYLRTRTA
ncbi:MAG TPA: hypothetical protein VK191_12955 [Symbiobacteriaceae bacterium]|nr:hypothetical protein [Symbiobacteriaceae bacterium]